MGCSDAATVPPPAIADAATDADPTFDAGPVTDAAVDASDAGASSHCQRLASPVRFCEDFDGAEVGARWDVLTQVAGSQAGLDTKARSEPHAFAVLTRAMTVPGDVGHAHLRKTVKGVATKIRFAFSGRFPDVAPADGAIAIANYEVSLQQSFTLFLRDGTPNGTLPSLIEYVGGGEGIRHALSVRPPADVWTRVVIETDVTTSRVVVRFDDVIALDTAITPAASLDPTIRVGVYAFGPAAPFAAHYDDVELDF